VYGSAFDAYTDRVDASAINYYVQSEKGYWILSAYFACPLSNNHNADGASP
jgi:hypothetical protein